MQKKLILTISSNYPYAKIKPFIESLENTKYGGDIVLFVTNLSKKTVNLIRKNKNIKIISYNEKYFQKNNLSIVQYRFILYYDYLMEHINKYSEIFIADIRDIIFQKDPFDFKEKGKINFFLEDNKIKNCKTNCKWIKPFLNNKEKSNKILNNLISCAGTTIGESKEILNYLKEMKNLMYLGNDQGLHNYLIYNKKFKSYKLFKNFEGPVLTLVYQDMNKLLYNPKKELINKDNSTINVIHQYDRYPELRKKFNAPEPNRLSSQISKIKIIGKIRRRISKSKYFSKIINRFYQKIT